MRVPVSWLREYVPLEMPLGELAERLSIASAEVEAIERRGVPDVDGNLDHFRIGRVLEAGKHPNADRLQLCQVDVGEGEPRQIVCGAWNFGAGATVAVALPGAVLANGITLEPTKLRGELSNGMILSDAGMRPISNVVDVTNYAMLALGNPLHAFDYATLAEGQIVVRRARKGEQLQTLEETVRDLTSDDLLIADAERPIALAGIKGGLETGIDPDRTTDVLLEAANFEPYTIYRTSERLRLRTEGSNRWEKGVDPHLASQAAALATQLLAELANAKW